MMKQDKDEALNRSPGHAGRQGTVYDKPEQEP